MTADIKESTWDEKKTKTEEELYPFRRSKQITRTRIEGAKEKPGSSEIKEMSIHMRTDINEIRKHRKNPGKQSMYVTQDRF